MHFTTKAPRRAGTDHCRPLRLASVALFLAISGISGVISGPVLAQEFRFDQVRIEGNQRVEQAAILGYAGIARGTSLSAGELNAAYQNIVGSGLFESVEITPQGNTLLIAVKEYPTINRISIEGNRRLKDEALVTVVKSRERFVYNPTQAETDAAEIAAAYNAAGRVAARVSPKIIRRSDNRVDLVFEVFEGGLAEVERIGFVGNQVYSDGRLRRVVETKQAGVLRALIKSDTFVADRIEFDKQVLRDFYLSRGYVDFRTTAVNAQLAQERDGYFITFNIEEGQQFRFGETPVTSDLAEVDVALFQAAVKVKSGTIYSPIQVEADIAKLEKLAIKQGLDFVRVEPRITRNDRDLTLDVEYALVKGPRIFVERIDIEGNTTTLDQVIRRQFRVAEGDSFNPREIREAAERIRALGFFTRADVNAREGSNPDQVIVDVELEETTTGSLTFGGTFSSNSGFGLLVQFRETNFLGRGQPLNLQVSGADDNQVYGIRFTEPALLGRDLSFDMDLGYRETENSFANFDTRTVNFRPGLEFPISENGRFGVYAFAEQGAMIASNAVTGALVAAEIAQDDVLTTGVGYTYSFDTRRVGLDPNLVYVLEFGQKFAGGDASYIQTTAKAIAQTKVLNEEVTLRATLEGGVLSYSSGSSRSVDRFQIGSEILRGFTPDGIGPREVVAGVSNDSLGGNLYVVARFEAEFPLGLPEEYGVSGGLFYDVGSVWGLDQTNANVIYDDFSLRHSIGASLFWETPVGPLRFNFAKALKKETFDEEQTFNVTISTNF
jgi:outer membrane protein insertion porin family